MIVAVDFDNTIAKTRYPRIIRLKFMARLVLRRLYKEGHLLVLWTCREGYLLKDAVNFCYKHGIVFDYHNENSKKRIEQYNGDCRKISCDLLIDDMAGIVFWPYFYLKVKFKELLFRIKGYKNIKKERSNYEYFKARELHLD